MNQLNPYVCAYCDKVVPTQRHKAIKHKGETLYFCNERGELDHFSKWHSLHAAKKASIAVLNIAKSCDLGVCEKSIRDVFRIFEMREIALRIIERIENNVRRIRRRAITSIKKLLLHLKTITDAVELKPQYQQLKMLLT